jgi:ABC-type glycerol-3-phosphate transport system substrate-binding protein
MSSFISTRFRSARQRRLRTGLIALAVVAIAGGSLTAAKGIAAASSPTPLLVWVDSTRIPNIKAYEKAHPNVKINLVTYDGNNATGTLQSKFALFNRVGHGWPDVYFSESNFDAASLASPQYKAAQVLSKGLVPKGVLNKFSKGTLGDCTINGQVVCLRNDIGQDVLWYNKTLMSQFGYQVPTTWQQWQAIGLEVGKQHPGYIVGTTGNSWDASVYLQASKCPMSQLIDANTVRINPSSPNCTRVAGLLDPLIANGTAPVANVFAATFAKQYGPKVLMMIGPSWYGDYLFASPTGVNTPAGQLAAATPLSWNAGEAPVTGDVGGGLWFVSSHTKQAKAAASLITWLTTSFASQGIAPTYPAYGPDQGPWIAKQQKSGYFANDLGPVFAKAATQIWTGWSAMRYVVDAVWASSVTPALKGGSTLASQLPALGQALKNQAQVDGYTVVTK